MSNITKESIHSQMEINLSLYLNKRQQSEYERHVKTLGLTEIADVVKHGFTLVGLLTKALEDDCEIIVVNKKKAKIMITEDGKKMAVLGSPSSIKFINKEVKETLGIQEQIQDANLGLMISDIGNYAEKNN